MIRGTEMPYDILGKGTLCSLKQQSFARPQLHAKTIGEKFCDTLVTCKCFPEKKSGSLAAKCPTIFPS